MEPNSFFKNITSHKTSLYVKILKSHGMAPGFSLIEIGIVLMIIAVLMGTFYGYNAGKDDIVKRRQTLAKMEIIEKALSQYVAENDRLPCPSNIGAPLSSGITGQEACWGQQSYTVTTFPTSYSGSANADAATVRLGGMPYAALKLPAGFALDSWGNLFGYILSGSFAGVSFTYGSIIGPDIFYIYPFEQTNMGFIKIKDVTGAQRTDQAVYALISHGPNGYGSYSRTTGSYSSFGSSYDPNEAENAEYATTGGTWNGTFVSSEPYYSTIGTTTNGPVGATGYTSTTSYFDDIVHWKTKWQIIRETGSLLSNSNCTLAYNVLTKQDTSYSSVYYNYYCNATSNKPANAMCSFILNSLARKVNDLCLNKVS